MLSNEQPWYTVTPRQTVKSVNFKTRDFSPLIEWVLAGVALNLLYPLKVFLCTIQYYKTMRNNSSIDSELQRKHSFLQKLSSLASFYTVTQHAILTHLIPFAKCYVFFIWPTPQIHAISKKSNLMALTKEFLRK